VTNAAKSFAEATEQLSAILEIRNIRLVTGTFSELFEALGQPKEEMGDGSSLFVWRL